MGVVYKACHLKLNRVVALKMILAGVHAGAAELARFKTEAEAVARLQHAGIVQIYEVGEYNSLPFLALEFCAGGSLDRKLAGTPLPPAEAARLAEQLARAMQAAHQQHVIHRDLKPGNVLLTADGQPKVTDFVLAKKLDEVGQTLSGAVMGTPSYMAPEQAGGKTGAVGPAADVYALGAILYELLTGRPPFKAATNLDTILQVVSEEPVAPTQLNAKVPRDLETICLKCLQKEPPKRYASAADLAEDLRRFRAGEPIAARPVGRVERAVKWVKRNPVVAGAAVVVLLALTLGTTLSYLKYLDAEEQKGIAETSRKEAEQQKILAEGKEKAARREADKARKARDFLVSIFKLSDRKGEGGTLTARQILDHADRRLAAEFADQPELRADLEKAIEEVYAALGTSGPQAMILEARGTVRLQSARAPKRQAVPQTLLYHDDRLVLGGDDDVCLVVTAHLAVSREGAGRPSRCATRALYK
jgi:hypothetical protein